MKNTIIKYASFLFISIYFTPVHAENIYSPWHGEIASISPVQGNLYIYFDSNVEINPSFCSKGTGYILSKKKSNGDPDPHFEENYAALLAAFFNKSDVRVIVSDQGSAECQGGQARIQWVNIRHS